MKRAYFVFVILLSLFAAFPCGIKLWIAYDLLAIPCYVAIVLVLPFASLMHELGHMLFGAICKIKAVPEFKLFGSSCVKLMPKTDKRLRARLFFTAAGGLAVNLIFIILGYLPLHFSVFPAWLCVFLPSSGYLFLLNLYGASSDAAVCEKALGNTDEAKVMLAVLTVQAQVLNGKPIEEVDEKLLFDVPVIREDDPSFISLTELRYEYYKAKGEEEQAEQYKKRLEDLKHYLN